MHPQQTRDSLKLPLLPPRNTFAQLARMRRAGAHRKTNKAMRRLEKQRSPSLD